MTHERAIEMFIKPNFKFFLFPFGFTCIHSAYTFNSFREAKIQAEKQWIEKKTRYDIFNVYYRDVKSDFGGGWRSKRILRMDKNNCTWDSYFDSFDLHTAYLFSYDENTISKWDTVNWKNLVDLETRRPDFWELTEEDIRSLISIKEEGHNGRKTRR